MARAADLEVDQALVLELDLLVVDPPRQQHRPVDPEEIVAGQAIVGFGADGRRRRGASDGGPSVGQRTRSSSAEMYPCWLIRRPRNRSIILLCNFSCPPRQSLPVGRTAARQGHRNGGPKGHRGRDSTLTQAYFKKGAWCPLHAHSTEMVVYVLQGALRAQVDGEDVTVREGEVLIVPAGVPHQAESLDDTFVMTFLERAQNPAP